jgi:hypothetical protein
MGSLVRAGGGTALLAAMLVVSGCGRTGSTDQPERPRASVSASSDAATTAARALIALARDPGSGPRSPWASAVDYSIGGVEVGAVRAGADLTTALAVCPAGASEYEGHACPVSPLMTLKNLTGSGGEPVVEKGEAVTVGCNRYRPPAASVGLDAVTIRPPDDERDCFNDFAVTLYVDDAGDVGLVDFTLSGP